MGKRKDVPSFTAAKFLFALRDGREKDYMMLASEWHMPITPMTQTNIDMMAAPLRKRGLIKGACGSYRITDAGMAWLRGEGLQYVQMFLMEDVYKKLRRK